MKVIFDEGSDFAADLDNIVSTLDRWDTPLVVVPTNKDAKMAKERYSNDENTSHITFISYKYFMSKKWIADDDYDHIDFFRADQFFMNASYGIKCGYLTVRRVNKKKEEVTE